MEELLGQLRSMASTDQDILIHTLLTNICEALAALTPPPAPPAQ